MLGTRGLVRLGKMFFIWLQKLFLFSRKSNFRVLYLQISWDHRMPKHKTINTFHLKSKHSLIMEFGQFKLYYKRKNFIKKWYKNCGLKTSFKPFCVYKELSRTSIGKRNFWSKLSKFFQISMLTSDSLLQRILQKLKRASN